MCMEDIRIGRKTNTIERLQTTTQNVSAQAVGPNDMRIALIWFCRSANNIVISTSPLPDQNSGMSIPQGNVLPLVMTIEEWGDLVTKPWFVMGGTTGTYIVFEVLLTDR